MCTNKQKIKKFLKPSFHAVIFTEKHIKINHAEEVWHILEDWNLWWIQSIPMN